MLFRNRVTGETSNITFKNKDPKNKDPWWVILFKVLFCSLALGGLAWLGWEWIKIHQ